VTSESPAILILIVLIAILVIIGGVALLVLGLIIPVDRVEVPGDAFTFSGTATYVDLEGGFWGFIADDGTRYLPVDFATNPGLMEGQRVWVTAVPADVSTIQMWGKPIRVRELVAQVPATPFLTENLWVLDAVRDNQSLASIPAGTRVTLTFIGDGTFQGSGPVNHYFGQYAVKDREIRLDQIGFTEMAGSPDRMRLETMYFSLLGDVRSFGIRERVLTLEDGSGSALATYHAEAVFT
jgi:heat shock protein HslJ